MKKYYTCTEKGDSYIKKQTLEEIMKYFKPNAEDFPEEFEAWQKAVEEDTMEAAQEFIDNYVNEVEGIHYHDYIIEVW